MYHVCIYVLTGENREVLIKTLRCGVLLHLGTVGTFNPGVMLSVVGFRQLCLGWCGKVLCVQCSLVRTALLRG